MSHCSNTGKGCRELHYTCVSKIKASRLFRVFSLSCFSRSRSVRSCSLIWGRNTWEFFRDSSECLSHFLLSVNSFSKLINSEKQETLTSFWTPPCPLCWDREHRSPQAPLWYLLIFCSFSVVWVSCPPLSPLLSHRLISLQAFQLSRHRSLPVWWRRVQF